MARSLAFLPQAPWPPQGGVDLGALGRHAEALGAADRALALRPDYAEAHSNRGVALEGLGRHAEALGPMTGPWPCAGVRGVIGRRG